jgi:hypothetical protein
MGPSHAKLWLTCLRQGKQPHPKRQGMVCARMRDGGDQKARDGLCTPGRTAAISDQYAFLQRLESAYKDTHVISVHSRKGSDSLMKTCGHQHAGSSF